MSEPVIACEALAKTFGLGDVAVPVLRGVTMAVMPEAFWLIAASRSASFSFSSRALAAMARTVSNSSRVMWPVLASKASILAAAMASISRLRSTSPRPPSKRRIDFPRPASSRMCRVDRGWRHQAGGAGATAASLPSP